MWVRNAWYVPACSHETSGDGLPARTILNNRQRRHGARRHTFMKELKTWRANKSGLTAPSSLPTIWF